MIEFIQIDDFRKARQRTSIKKDAIIRVVERDGNMADVHILPGAVITVSESYESVMAKLAK